MLLPPIYPIFLPIPARNPTPDSSSAYQNRLGILHGGTIASMGTYPCSPLRHFTHVLAF